MTVQFLDLGASYAELQSEIEDAILTQLRSGIYIGGAAVESFEKNYSQFVGAEHCVGVGNGLDALRLALIAHGLGPGDEVIVPSNTFIATWLAVSQAGGVPIPVDPNPTTFNIEASSVKNALSARTRFVIPVHLYGQPCELNALRELTDEHGIKIIEDAAQAHGAYYQGRRIGSHGNTVAWSFYPGKNLGALGDGGAITTDDPDLAERLRLLRNYGSSQRYSHTIQGFNSRLDSCQAAVLNVKLRYLDAWNLRRVAIARRYLSGLEDTGLILPATQPDSTSVWHLFCVRHASRDFLISELDRAGIRTLVHYPVPPHLQPAYATMGFDWGDFPVAEEMSETLLSLPIGPSMSESDADYVIDTVRKLV